MTDNPWMDVTQNQCTGGESLQAGKPFHITVYFSVLVTVTQNNTTLTSRVQFIFPGSSGEITAQQYGP